MEFTITLKPLGLDLGERMHRVAGPPTRVALGVQMSTPQRPSKPRNPQPAPLHTE